MPTRLRPRHHSGPTSWVATVSARIDAYRKRADNAAAIDAELDELTSSHGWSTTRAGAISDLRRQLRDAGRADS
jgi:uncharacterized protein YbaA (DUF1428 family)